MKAADIDVMVSETEAAKIRKFVCKQLRAEPDLSKLTIGILKKRYLAHMKCDSLSPDAKKLMKQVVGEELMKMQENDKSAGEIEPKEVQNKRKRKLENEELESDGENESKAKKIRSSHASSSESEDESDCKTGSNGEEEIESPSTDAEKDVKKSKQEQKQSKRQSTSDDSAEGETDESESKGNKSSRGDSPKKVLKKKANTTKNEEKNSIDASEAKKIPGSDKDSESDADSLSEKGDKSKESESSDSEKDRKVSAEKNNDSDSESSSLPSLEDDKGSGGKNAPNEKKKKTKTENKPKRQKDDDKAVVRLKRYISLCGVRSNYKKMLDGCSSVRSKVTVLKKHLEELGVQGNPSIEKCKKVRMKREEAQELAALDVNNIITSQGRPKRGGTTAIPKQTGPPSSAYQRTLDSDSDQENKTDKGQRKISQWANLHGIISDDADSD
ncbi:HIRA-interacting protein 3 [Menidia menidia]